MRTIGRIYAERYDRFMDDPTPTDSVAYCPIGSMSSYKVGDRHFRVYHVDQDTLERFETLEPSDLNRAYIIVAGTITFVSSEGDQK
jgi:hypothetical protein